jgi:mannosylglycoprotein endo-beta-mannosidase
MNLFNDFIAHHHLKELRRHGSRFTWTNKQQVPVMCVLDRVLVSTEWEMLFPMAVIQVETRIGSDHSPMLVTDGSQNIRKSNRFYLERQWFGHSDFKLFVATKWCNAIISYRGDGTALDCWNWCIRALRKALRGWGANKSADLRRKKTALLTEIAALDKRADDIGLSAALWQQRYALEYELVQIYNMEEIYWSQRAHVQWLQEGDSNTAFFHSVANGRKGKCSIFSLETEEGVIRSEEELQKHIYDFYKKLFKSEPRGGAEIS